MSFPVTPRNRDFHAQMRLEWVLSDVLIWSDTESCFRQERELCEFLPSHEAHKFEVLRHEPRSSRPWYYVEGLLVSIKSGVSQTLSLIPHTAYGPPYVKIPTERRNAQDSTIGMPVLLMHMTCLKSSKSESTCYFPVWQLVLTIQKTRTLRFSDGFASWDSRSHIRAHDTVEQYLCLWTAKWR